MLIFFLQRGSNKREKKRDMREEARREHETIVVEMTCASIVLGEATAKAVQHIPEYKCNGDMTKALAFTDRVKTKHSEFMCKHGIASLY